jgi:hypothetical protein
MAGCGNEAAEMVNPAGAPTYNSGEGMPDLHALDTEWRLRLRPVARNLVGIP